MAILSIIIRGQAPDIIGSGEIPVADSTHISKDVLAAGAAEISWRIDIRMVKKLGGSGSQAADHEHGKSPGNKHGNNPIQDTVEIRVDEVRFETGVGLTVLRSHMNGVIVRYIHRIKRISLGIEKIAVPFFNGINFFQSTDNVPFQREIRTLPGKYSGNISVQLVHHHFNGQLIGRFNGIIDGIVEVHVIF